MADGEPFFCVSRMGMYAVRSKKGLSLGCDRPVIWNSAVFLLGNRPVILNYAAFLFSNGPKSGITGPFSTCFSSLDGRKAAKEDQGLTEAGEVGRVYDMISLEKVPGKLPGLGEAARSMHLCAPNMYHTHRE